ncbi:uncharacterized protein [Procambarus clarkii]|uniref:uncharacterized protein n=1 Tax=Procambarus clarkii TaxID=6728 RepID=UPI003743BC9F
MSSSASHGPDPGPALIRISPARVHTQVTQTVRYRPVRSLLLLSLVVVVSLFVLFTLSQMAVVHHTMMAQLGEPGRLGGAGVGVAAASGGAGGGGGGRAGRAPHRAWRSQFNQFKIEPLLIRNAPSVEVNTALAANRRRASQVAAIIVRNSLLVTQSDRYNDSTHAVSRPAGADAAPPTPARATPSPLLHPHVTAHTTLVTAHTTLVTAHITHSTNSSPHAPTTFTHSRLIYPQHPAAGQGGAQGSTRSSSSSSSSKRRHRQEERGKQEKENADDSIRHRQKDERASAKEVRHNAGVETRHKAGAETRHNAGVETRHNSGVETRHNTGVETRHNAGVETRHNSGVEARHNAGVEARHNSGAEARHNTDDKVSRNVGEEMRHNSDEKVRRHTERERGTRGTDARSVASRPQVRDPTTSLRRQEDAARRRFLSKARCSSADEECDNLIGAYQNILLGSKHPPQSPAHTAAVTSSASARGAPEAGATATNDAQSPSTHPYVSRSPSEPAGENEDIKATTKLPEVPGTEFGEAEKEFEPLYLREDDYDLMDSGITTSASPEEVMATSKATRAPHLTEEQLRNLPLCPEIPPGLLGHLDIDLDQLEKLQLEDVLRQLEWVSSGGRWSPAQEPEHPCLPRHKVAVILPYRDRLHHLVILLSWLHPILRRQQLEYTIYVAEQAGNATFNKGSIMNAGFMEAWQRSDANCFVFHDVDLLPENDRNMYSCPPQPRHLSVGVDTLGYKLPYFLLVGGVLSVRGDHFLRLNGYSNMYWGWGGEDDDMGYRIKQSGLSITRPPNMLARYTMIRHLKRRPLTWKVRGKLVRTSGRRYRLDGLNTLRYSQLALHRHPLFTHLLLDVGNPPENLVRLDAH